MSRSNILPILFVPLALIASDDPKSPPPGQMTTTTVTTTSSSPTGAVSPSEQTVVVPGSPDLPNREGTIRTGTPGANTRTVSGQVIRYQPGISVVLRQADGSERTYPISPNFNVPPDTHEGSYLTIPVSNGGQNVAPPPGNAGTLIEPASRTGTVTTSRTTKSVNTSTVKTSPGAVKLTPKGGTKPYVVKAYEPGVSVTVASPEGLEFHLRIDRRSHVPADLAVGNHVFIDTRNIGGAIYVRSLRASG